jgi:hypothetical protein
VKELCAVKDYAVVTDVLSNAEDRNMMPSLAKYIKENDLHETFTRFLSTNIFVLLTVNIL